MALEDSTNPMQGVSGPGPYAKRTDLSYQSQSYGDGVAYDANKSAVDLEKAPKNPKLSEAPVVGNAGITATTGAGIFDPSQQKDRPITDGIDTGLGLGSSALAMQKSAVKTSDTLAKMLPYDTDGSIAILYQQAIARGD
jgi:hypothetical protein